MTKNRQFLNSADVEVSEWAFRYLSGRGHHHDLVGRTHYEACTNLFNKLPSDRRKLLESEMRAAWRQRKYVANQKANGKKPGNFILSEAAFEKLENLAKEFGMPMNETLDKIIKQAHDAYQRKLKQKKVVKKAQPRKVFSALKNLQNANDRVNHTVGIPKGIPEK